MTQPGDVRFLVSEATGDAGNFHTRRSFLAASAAAGTLGLFGLGSSSYAEPSGIGASSTPPPAGPGGAAIRPFHVTFPQSDLVDLRRRIAATRWPQKENVSDATQGVQLATMQKLAQYWASNYDWRNVEARLNALPQFITTIDGLDIHFIHVRSKHPNALPVIITHGWPGSIIEQLKVIGPLTDPTAYGGKAEDAFDVVIPSLPGYGFSGKPTTTGWDPARIARAWAVLMTRLGYTRYVAQGGDWGNAVTETMALQTPPGLIAIHTNMAATIPADIEKALQSGARPPYALSADEKRAWDQLDFFYKHGLGYAEEMAGRPQTLYAIENSPNRPGRLDPRPRRSQLCAHRARLRRADRGPDPRRHPRKHHALLADQDGGLFGSALLGIQGWLLRPPGSLHSGCRERLSRRDLSSPEELVGEGLSQADLL